MTGEIYRLRRDIVRITGADRIGFLQGLVTQDMTRLENERAVFSCLLTPQGKYLFDFFAVNGGQDDLLIDLEAGAAEDFMRRLKPFKLRADVQMEDVTGGMQVFCGEAIDNPAAFTDPRHPKLGLRMIGSKDETLPPGDEALAALRYEQSIPEGSTEMIREKDTLIECGMDRCGAIAWKKGCYMGQELTARMKYRGLAKKAMTGFSFEPGEGHPAPGSDVRSDEKLVGEIRAVHPKQGIGLAMLRTGDVCAGMKLTCEGHTIMASPPGDETE